MGRFALAFCLLLLGSRAHAYQYWNDIRHSALMPDGSVVIRAENPSGTGIENYLLYAGAGIAEQAMVPIADGPSTVSAAAPGPASSSRSYGFRLIQGEELDFMPVRIADGASPTPSDLTRLAEDPAGDHLFGYVNLDLIDCRISFSGTKIFAALKNAGGGFPVSSGLTFFGYLLAIANPALSDPDTLFALMNTFNMPGIITPGLYRITGPGLGDLTKIGEVTVQEFPAANSLLLSCNIADLTADAHFSSWFNPADPTLGVAGFTQRITLLTGAQEADRTPGGRCYLRELSISPDANMLPVLTGLSIVGIGSEAYAGVYYLDSDGNCPVVAEIAFDGGAPFLMYPQSLDYGSPVEYRTDAGIPPLAGDSWSHAVARFSDNLSDTVEAEAGTTGIGDEVLGVTPQALRASIAPNPFNSAASVEIQMPQAGQLLVQVFDVRGTLVRTIASFTAGAGVRLVTWDGRNAGGLPCSSGLYLCKISSPEKVVVEKMLLLR